MGRSCIRSSDEHQKSEQGLARKSVNSPDWFQTQLNANWEQKFGLEKLDATEACSGADRNYVNDVMGKTQSKGKGQSETRQMSALKMKGIKLLN